MHITEPHEQFGGDDERNIVNRLTTGGKNGIQIEQKIGPREKYAQPIAAAVADVYNPRLGLFTKCWTGGTWKFLARLWHAVRRFLGRRSLRSLGG